MRANGVALMCATKMAYGQGGHTTEMAVSSPARGGNWRNLKHVHLTIRSQCRIVEYFEHANNCSRASHDKHATQWCRCSPELFHYVSLAERKQR